MGRATRRLALVICCSVGVPGTLAAQDTGATVVLHGRVEDAATRRPVAGVRVFSADSSAVAVTDSLGLFDLRAPAAADAVVHLDGLGYLFQTFELSGEPRSLRYVLLLEPEPIAIQGLTVEAEASLDRLVRRLESRRNGYPHAMGSFDRAWLDRFGPVGGTVGDLLAQRYPRISACRRDPVQLCIPGRNPTPSNPRPEIRLLVCVDEVRSLHPTIEISTLPIESVALVEVYGRDAVRVYTARHMLNRARSGFINVLPLWMGC